MKKTLYIILFILLLALIGCDNEINDRSEGVISYKVSYPKMDKDNVMYSFIPKKMKLLFKRDKYITNLESSMGLFKASSIVDKDKKEFSMLVKLIDKKYITILKDNDIENSINKLPAFNIEFTDETKTILNYTCKKAIVTSNNEFNEVFTVYYTNEIDIKTPNWANQFKEIDGIMLEYQYRKYEICMQFTAEKIDFRNIDKSEFEVNNKYVKISESELNKKMENIFTNP